MPVHSLVAAGDGDGHRVRPASPRPDGEVPGSLVRRSIEVLENQGCTRPNLTIPSEDPVFILNKVPTGIKQK
jgi:hypothetical protein